MTLGGPKRQNLVVRITSMMMVLVPMMATCDVYFLLMLCIALVFVFFRSE